MSGTQPVTPAAASKALRVLVIPSSCLAGNRTVGGGERYALEYAQALSALTPTTHGLFHVAGSSHPEGDLTHRTFSLRSTQFGIRLPLTREARRQLKAYDLIHLMCFPTPFSDALILLARWRGQKVVLTDVGGMNPCYSTYLSRLHPRLTLARWAHGLAHLSQYAGTFFSGWPQAQTVLYGGASSRVVSQTGAPGGYALMVGRLFPHKGILQVIQALPPQIPLHVVGRPYDADYFAQLQAAASGKQVKFLTNADDATVRAEYQGASVVLQTSIPTIAGAADKAELLGLVTLEAMASGKPVIVTSITSLPELVREGETGFIVPPHDLPALADRISRLVNDADLSRRLGAAAARHVAANFTWKATAERGLDLYQKIRAR